MSKRLVCWWLLLAAVSLGSFGCTSGTAEKVAPQPEVTQAGPNNKESVANETKSAPTMSSSGAEEVLLQPFTPPPLAEIDAKAEWEDSPVRDTLALLRKRQATEKPIATVVQALAMRNDSEEANTKILNAMGWL